MKLEEVCFDKKKKYENGEEFSFQFSGTVSNPNNDKEKINNLINNFINNQSIHKDMLTNISFIRTILVDYEEKLLVASYSNGKGIKEVIKYENGALFSFIYKDKTEEKQNSMYVAFTSGKGLNISFPGFESNNIVDYSSSEIINKKITNLIKYIYSLKNVKTVYLDIDSKLLIEIYKLFYNENPDFSTPTISIKVQAMMSILSQFGISFGDIYGFRFWGKDKMPMSLSLEQLVDKLFPLGEIIETSDPIKIKNEQRKVIKIVGENIREAIHYECNKEASLEELITISKVIYAGRYRLSSNTDTKELCEFTNCIAKEVESSIRLVKCIENRINQLDK